MFPNPIKHRAPKSWLKITITVDPRMTEAVTAYLSGLTGSGLEITAPEPDRAEADHAFRPEKITAYIPVDHKESGKEETSIKTAELRRFLTEIRGFFPGGPEPHLDSEIIMEEDWGEKWKRFFTAFQITPHLTIKPSWESAAEPENDGDTGHAVIAMDPGLAFGTGHHASTQLGVLLLEELFHGGPAKPVKVLDVGTGSGILAMASALFGAREVLALDNDPDAVATARENIGKNLLADRVSVSGRDVATIKPGFDLVVANITHDVLAGLAQHLSSLIKTGGYLVLSGILKGEQEDSIRAVYTELGLASRKVLTKDEWAALLFQKI